MNEENKLKWSGSWHKYFCTLLGRENDMSDKCKACDGTGHISEKLKVEVRMVVETNWYFRGFPILLGLRPTDGCASEKLDIEFFKTTCSFLNGE